MPAKRLDKAGKGFRLLDLIEEDLCGYPRKRDGTRL